MYFASLLIVKPFEFQHNVRCQKISPGYQLINQSINRLTTALAILKQHKSMIYIHVSTSYTAMCIHTTTVIIILSFKILAINQSIFTVRTRQNKNKTRNVGQCPT